jgi:hypothetical protein
MAEKKAWVGAGRPGEERSSTNSNVTAALVDPWWVSGTQPFMYHHTVIFFFCPPAHLAGAGPVLTQPRACTAWYRF